MAKRLTKTPDYVVASHFVQSNHPETAVAGQFDQPKRLRTTGHPPFDQPKCLRTAEPWQNDRRFHQKRPFSSQTLTPKEALNKAGFPNFTFH
jgi:hypothetical protein